jgi:hypothetical protein
MAEMLNSIYESTYKETLDQLLTFSTKQKSITFIEKEMKLATVETSFLESVLMFINYSKSLKFPSMSTMIYIFNYDLLTGKYDFSGIKNKNFSEEQKAVYENIFNFPNYLNNMNKIGKEINDLFDSEINAIFNLNFYLSLILIGLHVFLLLISLSIISFLKRTTADSNYIFSKLITGDWSRYLQNKVTVLSEMLKFYKRDPIKCSTKLRSEQEDAARVNREHQKEASKNSQFQPVADVSKETFDAEVAIVNLISPLTRVLIYLFSFYLLYAFVFILLFNDALSDIKLSSEYATNYLNIDKGLMNCVILLQCILFSNQTDSSLLTYLSDYSSFISNPQIPRGFIINIVEEIKVNSRYLAVIERNHPKFKLVESDANLYSDCDYLYKNIVDDVYAEIASNYDGGTLTDNLIKLCNNFPVMKKKKFINIIEEINYVTMKLMKNYDYAFGSYMKMKETNDNTEFFDDFTLSVMIVRPLQTYLIKNQIFDLMAKSEHYFLICVIGYMIGNLIVECVIFFIINRKLITRVLVINEEIRCLTLCITA